MHRSKVCFKCGIYKPLTDFYRHPMMGDGRLGKCKECTKKDVSENRGKRIDYYREYDRDRAKIPERAKTASAISAAWRKADKRRGAAHNAVTRAVRSGALKRTPCERCGRNDAFAHHECYDHKLAVNWLCQPCHKQRHKEMVLGASSHDPLLQTRLHVIPHRSRQERSGTAYNAPGCPSGSVRRISAGCSLRRSWWLGRSAGPPGPPSTFLAASTWTMKCSLMRSRQMRQQSQEVMEEGSRIHDASSATTREALP